MLSQRSPMNREGWLMDKKSTATKRFHRDEKSWHREPYVFVDSGWPISGQPALLKTRDYLHLREATAEWKKLRLEGWAKVKPQWGAEVDV